MALKDAIDKQMLKKNDTRCSVQILIDSLSEADRKVLLEAFDSGMPSHPLVYALRSEGYKSSDNSMNAHRAGKCKCQK
jgi:hypothetical protein